MEKTGIFIEIANGRIKNANYGMITAARGSNSELYAFVINFESEKIKEKLYDHGIDKIIEIRAENDFEMAWNPVSWSKAVMEAMNAFDIHILLALTTGIGKELLPRIAAELDAPLVMDCIGIDFDKKTAETFRYSGKTIATVKLTGMDLLFGIKPNIIDAVPVNTDSVTAVAMSSDSIDSTTREIDALPETKDISALTKPEIIPFTIKTDFLKTTGQFKNIKLNKTVMPETSSSDNFSNVNLMDADIIISGGRGMKNRENFKILSDCAKQLGAAVGASRAAVDSGWVPYSMQVGQTGEKVSPKVYIACGIAGSIQHFAGMKTSNMIIAVNIDLDASIIALCDYYIVMDLFEIVPLLTKVISEINHT